MHWRNSNFQIRHFLIGKCHTPDEAYRLGCELREERTQALGNATIASRRLAVRCRWLRWVAWVPWLGELARIELDRIEMQRPTTQRLIDACAAEIAHLDECLRALEPHRKFSLLPDAQAHQAAQAAEWREEMRWRAENYLLAGGGIPHDQIAAMRLHPDFQALIWPHIQEVRKALNAGVKLPASTHVARLLCLYDKTD